MIKRYLILLLASCLIPTFILGQLSRKRNDEKECVICHAQWHPKQGAADQLLPQIKTSTIIDGKPGVVSDEQMCISCHDGYVMDSREIFSSDNHQGDLDKSHIRIQELPLGTDDEIYCGTCHTPHALKPKYTGGLAPFLREKVNNSALCLDCHSDQAKDHVNHPIHLQVSPDHKMPNDTYFGKNDKLECMTCHPIHGSNGVIGVTGQDRSELCSACHESYFEIQLTDHDLPTTFKNKSGTIGPSLNEQDACAACHSSHDGKGKVMWAMDLNRAAGENGYCLGCHGEDGLGREKAFSHVGHPVADKQIKKDIPVLGIKAGDQLLCTSCHDPHQWEYSRKHAVTSAEEEGTEYTSFLRLPDDAQGQLCTACHSNQKVIKDSDHSVSRAGFQQHFRSKGNFNGQCSACHDTHATSGLRIDVIDPNVDITRNLCEACHSKAHYPTTVGGFDHPMGNPLEAGIELPGFKGELTCITCHDPHQWGTIRESSLAADLTGNDANSFLRVTNWPEPGLCLTCHLEQETVLKTDHDLGNADHSACSFCHTAHNSQAEYGILSVFDETAGETYNEKFCFTCHQEEANAAEKIPAAWNHPHEYGTITHNVRGTGEWLDFPLFDRDKPDEAFGFVDCFTCHDPHKWSFKDDLVKTHTGNDEGDYMTSFLRNPSSKTLCTDCHGANTLWKYNYYHDPVKRKRY